jgi:branched-subunit amino acid transport protein
MLLAIASVLERIIFLFITEYSNFNTIVNRFLSSVIPALSRNLWYNTPVLYILKQIELFRGS